jgi:uncharacterized membrane protein YfcA
LSPAHAAIAAVVGAVAGVLSGLFGVGGGIVMTPGFDWLLPISSIAALETPLPVIFPTSLMGAATYRAAGELDARAAAWMAPAGLVGAVVGALLTRVVDTTILLLATAAILAYQSLSLLRGRGDRSRRAERSPRGATLVAIGLSAGLVSGLLGIGGGIVIVPILSGWLGMPLKRTLGTSLLTIPAIVIPGTVVHAALGNIEWWVFVFATLGAVPGARLGARLALGTREASLRLAVGSFMLLVAAAYGVAQAVALVKG